MDERKQDGPELSASTVTGATPGPRTALKANYLVVGFCFCLGQKFVG